MFTSGTQALQGREAGSRDPRPWLHSEGGRTKFHYVCGGKCSPDYDPRPEFQVVDNPILAEFRKGGDGGAQAWCLALASLNEDTPGSIQEAIIDALGYPRGPGWEDIHYRQSQRFVDHAYRVLERLYRFSVMKEEVSE